MRALPCRARAQWHGQWAGQRIGHHGHLGCAGIGRAAQHHGPLAAGEVHQAARRVQPQFADDGGTEVALLPSLVTLQVGDGPIYEYDRFPYVFLKNSNDYYGLYDAKTGKTVLNHEIKSFATALINESIWVENKDGKYAIYNLKTNSIGKGYIFESNEAALIEMYGE